MWSHNKKKMLYHLLWEAWRKTDESTLAISGGCQIQDIVIWAIGGLCMCLLETTPVSQRACRCLDLHRGSCQRAEISSDSSQKNKDAMKKRCWSSVPWTTQVKPFTHLSSCCADLSSLTKIMDRETLHLVMKATIHPVIQFNVPEKFLNLVEDVKLKTWEEKLQEKLKKVLLPKHNTAAMTRQPRNSSTRILAAAVWLKFNRKFFFLEGTAKEACELFQVWAKQLSKVLTGRKYLGGSQAWKRKEKCDTRKEQPTKKRKVTATVSVDLNKEDNP